MSVHSDDGSEADLEPSLEDPRAAYDDALTAWEIHMQRHNSVIRSLAAQHAEEAGERIVEAALRSYRKLRPERFEHGDRVRVSFLALPSVRAVTKSRILGELMPLFSPKVYSVQLVHDHGDVGNR